MKFTKWPFWPAHIKNNPEVHKWSLVRSDKEMQPEFSEIWSLGYTALKELAND